jgi:hypothetical protein
VTKCIYYPLFKDLLTWEDNDLLDQTLVIELSAFFERIAATLKELTGQDYFIVPLYLETVEADHQKPHLDDDRATSREKIHLAYILHLPLSAEGRVLRAWSTPHQSQSVHSPFGRAKMIQADVVHGGCYGTPGNSALAVKFVPRMHPIDPTKLAYIGDVVNPTSLGPSLIHDHAWDYTKKTSPGRICPSVRYISKLRELFPILFRNGEDPTLNAPSVIKTAD